MNLLSQLRIGTRLALGFAIVLLLAVCATSVALYNARVNAEATRRMMEQPLAKERLASDWYVLIYSAVARTALIARSSDDSLSTTFADVIADSSKKGGELIGKLKELMASDEEKAVFEASGALRATYQKAKTDIMNAKKAGDAEQAEKLYREVFMPSSTAYQGKVQALLTLQRKAIDDTAHAIDAANDRSNMLLMLLAVLMVGIGSLAAWVISRSITLPLKSALEIASTVANGDLTTRFDDQTSPCEIGDLMTALKGMNDALRNVVSQVQSGTTTIATASNQIAAGNMDLSQRTEEQASSLEETASSMEELTSTVRQNAENAKQANQLAQAASDVAERGGAIVGQVVDTMGSIDASSRKIVDIISVIDGIAFQTNILALNAAVEAARAGEQGRGFAVVASEVRNLAQRSAAAAKEIKELIGNSVQQVDLGAKLVQQAGATMGDVVASVRRVTDIMGEITSASSEQSIGIDQVNTAITQMDQVTQQNAALVEQAAAAAASMQEQAARLAEVAASFKLGEEAARPALAAPVRAKAALPAARAAATSARPALRQAAPARPAAKLSASKPATVGGDKDWEEF
ncbi:methyl-accepting chemotaxis protein [Duganella violaceipulchra]|uniref:MCP four helix bundle domain-containing protein n=1 Tax=Duganella violaceipulchra TaxID=2849652 RepID=A0AA41HAG9_9BURK|nr:methyl-accepting chemotaxis protein [Duganella violaceicalia]MBV6321227.1 MCP four helix bundle domain-containing protein [Duganella violaceicalia]MCP2009525.1 methyl-accepting chemotaxis protein [Duganella violaceicalia]